MQTVFITKMDTYAEMLRAMRGDNRLLLLGVDVKSIRRIVTGEIMLVVEKEAAKKGTSFKALAKRYWVKKSR